MPFQLADRRLPIVGSAALSIFALTPLPVLLIKPLGNWCPVPNLNEIADPAGIVVLGGALNAYRSQAQALTPIVPGAPIEGPIALSQSGARHLETETCPALF